MDNDQFFLLSKKNFKIVIVIFFIATVGLTVADVVFDIF